MITIFTPTYNRAFTLTRLYESLCIQKSFDFEWLVIDDGSTDDTKQLIASFQEDENSFSIRYYYQENGGKASAIRTGVQLAFGDFFLFLDSDDYLTAHAIAAISPYLNDIKSDSRICGVTGLKVSSLGVTLGTYIPNTVLNVDYLSFRLIYKAVGDYTEIVKTSILKDFPFPSFEGEKFCTEALVLNRIAHKYVSRYVNVPVLVCEYLPDGLSETYDQIMAKSPQASSLYYKELFCSSLVPIKLKMIYLKSYWKYYGYCRGKAKREVRPTLSMYMLYPVSSLTIFLWNFYRKVCIKSGLDILLKKKKLKRQCENLVLEAGVSFYGTYRLGKSNMLNRNVIFANSTMDNYSYINYNSVVNATSIGKFSSIGPNCVIGLGEHPVRDFVTTSPHLYKAGLFLKATKFKEVTPVRIGNDVWIGANVTICNGVTIHDGVVVGANSVVLHDIPPYSIYAGVPSKFVRKRFMDDKIDFLLNLEWWNKDSQWIKQNANLFSNVDDLYDYYNEVKK